MSTNPPRLAAGESGLATSDSRLATGDVPLTPRRSMNLPFELHVALRYLLAKRKQAFISVISLISTLGVTVGVMALVIALSLMTGLQTELRDRILGANPHVFVWKPGGFGDARAETDRLRQVAHVTGASPTIIGKALVQATAGEDAFLSVKGVDPIQEPSVTDIAGAMRSGNIESLSNHDSGRLPGILLGTDAAKGLGVSVGDTVSVLTGERFVLTPTGRIPRRGIDLRVSGTFNLGVYEIDSQTGFVSMDTAKLLFDKEGPDAIQLRLDDIYQAQKISDEIGHMLGPDYIVQDWGDQNRSLFDALWLEKMAVSLTIFLIVMVAALNIVASLILLVMEKHRDIAILKTMGASAKSVMAVFMTQGLIIGIIGTTVGATAGAVIADVLNRYKVIRIPGDVYQITYVPFRILPLDFAMVIAAAIVVCFVATIYPSRQAARLDPAQALRYE
jgi:lipoprotein-releasing system permease protein